MSGPLDSVSRALGWWFGALAAVAAPGPDPFRRGVVRLRPRAGGFAVVGPDGAMLHFLSAEAPTGEALKSVRRARARYLDLDEETVLAVTATLPRAAQADLREAVALRITELTPFTEDEVVYDLGHPRVRGTEAIAVLVYVVPNRLLADRRAELENLGIRLDGIIASETGEATGAEIADFAPEFRRRSGRRAGVALAIAALIFAGGLGWLHNAATERQEAERLLLSEGIRTALEDVRQARDLEDEIAALSARLASPNAQHSEQIAPLELLEGISAALPDDAFLVQLSWSGDEVNMTGLAANASSLIAALEASPILSGVHFSAPVARDQRSERDRFSLTARTVKPEAAQ